MKATFNEPVEVDGTTFTLMDATTGAVVTAVVTYDSKNQATLNPSKALAGGTRYTATLTSGIVDSAGNRLAGKSWSFKTS